MKETRAIRPAADTVRSLAVALVLALPWAGSIFAATLRVPEDFQEIQAALDAAAEGDEVLVAAGEYVVSRPVTFSGKGIALRSREGATPTTIRMSETPDDPRRASVVVIEGGGNVPVVFEGFTLTGGQGSFEPNWARPFRGRGGGIAGFSGTHACVVGCVITGNRALEGGGLWAQEARLELRDCDVSSNWAGYRGGGLRVSGFVRITRTRIAGNSGGGLNFPAGSLQLSETQLLGNLSTRGAGLYADIAQVEARNCLFAGNFARGGGETPGWGGAIEVWSESSLSLWNCTITQNFAERGEGGGIWAGRVDEGAVVLTNSVVWGNWGGDLYSLYGRHFQVFYSCVGQDMRDIAVRLSKNLNVDPAFVSLGVFDFTSFRTVSIAAQDVELPAFVVDPGDYRLRGDSPLVDKGTDRGAPAVDMDGHARPCGQAVDIGAYETGDCSPAGFFLRGDADADARRTISDAVFTLLHLFLGGKEPSCTDAADADDNGLLNLADPVYVLNRLFRGGPPPPGPEADCGPDPTADELDCASHPPCGGPGG
ncbi:MAG: right-handed parallel beta-helix repeat-containing protein [Planctomycetes bacterium]|nr:right-handed parallel beta-helix repeat-containing protein [Planctomycetota bacterium]